MERYIVFGDSHARCFSDKIKTYSFSSSSAKGLNNSNSLSKTNIEIKQIIDLNKAMFFIFFFGKVDIDFILNHMYNKNSYLDLQEYTKNIVDNYISFIIGLNIKNIFICEIPIPHIDDNNMLKIINIPQHHINLNTHLDEKYKAMRYHKVLPFNRRLNLTLLFNKHLKEKCLLNGFTFLEINKYFGEKVPSKYIKPDKMDHHLDDSISFLYMENLI